jgi:hypothetical protein
VQPVFETPRWHVTIIIGPCGGKLPCASLINRLFPTSSILPSSPPTGNTNSIWHRLWCNYIPSWSGTRKCSRLLGDTLRSSSRTSSRQVHDLHKHNYNRSSLEMHLHTRSTALLCLSRARAGGIRPTAPSQLPFDDSPHRRRARPASSSTSPRSPSRASGPS